MKTILLTFFCTVILHSIAFSQNRVMDASLYTEYYLIQRSPAASLSKIGVTSWFAGHSGVTDEGLLSASFNNPGALRLESLKASAEFTYRTRVRYFDLMDYDDILYPSFSSVAYGDRRKSFSINYFRQYAQFVRSDPFEVTTVDQPDGTGETFTFATDVDIHSLAGTIQYSLTDNIGIGATVGGNYLRHSDKFWHSFLKLNGWSLLAIAGIHATFDDLSFGASIRYSSPFSMGDPETNSKLRVINPITNIEVTTKYFARLPIVYQVGMSVQALPFLKVSISDEIQNWAFVHSSYENISNFHVGVVASLTDDINLLFGHSEQFDPQSAQTDQVFVTVGVSVRMERLSLVVGVSDSEIFSPTRRTVVFWQPKEPFRQFIMLSGLTYSF